MDTGGENHVAFPFISVVIGTPRQQLIKRKLSSDQRSQAVVLWSFGHSWSLLRSGISVTGAEVFIEDTTWYK